MILTVPLGTAYTDHLTRPARERAAQEAEVARLTARVRELEQTNETLGKAIGLLHQMSEQEPAVNQPTNDPSDSSTPRTTSSDS